MRAMWCTLIAVCLVAAGAQPHRVGRTVAGTSTLRVATTAAATAPRRPSAPPDLGPCVAAVAVTVAAPARRLVAVDIVAPLQARSLPHRSPRSSRGPPHA